eukprot:4148399-Pleurochrysis_carterae.AAC.1
MTPTSSLVCHPLADDVAVVLPAAALLRPFVLSKDSSQPPLTRRNLMLVPGLLSTDFRKWRMRCFRRNAAKGSM